MASIIILADNPTVDFLEKLNSFGFGNIISSSYPVSDRPVGEQQYWKTIAKLPENVLYHPSLKACASTALVQQEASCFYKEEIQVIGVDLSMADCYIQWVGYKEFDRIDPNVKTLAEIQQR